MVQLLTYRCDHGKAIFCIFLWCTFTGVSAEGSGVSSEGSGASNGSDVMSPGTTMMESPAPSVSTVSNSSTVPSISATSNGPFSMSLSQSVIASISPSLVSVISEVSSSLAPTISITSTTDNTTTSSSVPMLSSTSRQRSSSTSDNVLSSTPGTTILDGTNLTPTRISLPISSTTILTGTTGIPPGPTTTPAEPSTVTTPPTVATSAPTGPTTTPTKPTPTQTVPSTPPTGATSAPTGTTTTPTEPTTPPTGATSVPTETTTTPTEPTNASTTPTGTTDVSTLPTNPSTQATPAESGENTLSEKLIAVIIGVSCGSACLLIIVVCLSVIICHVRRNTQANNKKKGLMQLVKVTVLGDAELQPLTDCTDPDYIRGKKNIAASCENFAAHLAAAEANAHEEPETAPHHTEQDGDNTKKGQESVTLGTFGFPVVVIESSSSHKNAENGELDSKSQDNKAQSESKTNTSSSHQDQSTTDGTSKSSDEKPKQNIDAQKLLETSAGAQKVQDVADTSSRKEKPENQTSSVQAAKLQDSKASATESPFESAKSFELQADDALTVAIKKLQDGKLDVKQETVDIQEANKPKSDAPAGKTTGDKQVENDGASSSAQGAERMSLTDAEKALAQMLKDLEVTRL